MFNNESPISPYIGFLLAMLIGLLGGLVRQLYSASPLVGFSNVIGGILGAGFVGFITYLLTINHYSIEYVIAMVGISGYATSEVLRFFTITVIERLHTFLGMSVPINNGRRITDTFDRRANSKADIEKLQAEILARGLEEGLSAKAGLSLKDGAYTDKGDGK
jgi:hypothetical protein